MTSSPTAEKLYRKEPKIYIREVSGRFANLRQWAMYVLLAMYYAGPWLSWDQRQALLFDLPGRKFYIFDLTLFPQDFIFLALLLVIAGLTLFFVTAVAGRLWCGYACPQTVWTEAFLVMERWAEGNRSRRMKLDQAPWTANKIVRKTFKQVMWLTFSLATGLTFVGYFIPMGELANDLVSFEAGGWELFWVVFYSFATYGNAGYLRAQVCKYMCPYARFQSAMFDKDTLIISYDEPRGEPRGGRSRKAIPATEGLGDCIDCTLCVQVCPTGIDIRHGLQYECIACAACIDVCDQVMDKMGYDQGLIKYTTEHAEKEKKSRVIRPRVIIYSILLLAISLLWLISIGQRTPLRAEMIRDRNALYRELSGSVIENVYSLRLVNMDDSAHDYSLEVSGLDGVVIDADPVSLPAEQAGIFTIHLQAPSSAGRGGQDIELRVQAKDSPALNAKTTARFFLPTGK